MAPNLTFHRNHRKKDSLISVESAESIGQRKKVLERKVKTHWGDGGIKLLANEEFDA